jgi:hypothetical protein
MQLVVCLDFLFFSFLLFPLFAFYVVSVCSMCDLVPVSYLLPDGVLLIFITLILYYSRHIQDNTQYIKVKRAGNWPTRAIQETQHKEKRKAKMKTETRNLDVTAVIGNTTSYGFKQ